MALPGPLEDSLLTPLLAARHEIVARPAGALELASAIASTRPEAVLVQAAPRLLGASAIETADEVGCRVLVFAGSPAERAHAASLGLHDVLDESSSWEEVAAALTGAPVLPPPSVEPRPRGRIVTVWGPTGAPGRSTTAIGIASELAATGARVALVDADPYGGSVAPMLGLLDEAPGFAAACRLAGSDGLDLAQLDRISVPLPVASGHVAVLTGLSRPSRWTELSADRVRTTLDVLRDWADVAVIDAGFSIEADEEIMSDVLAPRRNAATLVSVDAADTVVLVGSSDAVSLARLIRAHAELTEMIPADRVDVIVNRVRRSPVGFDARGQIAASLDRFAGIVPAAMIPFDPSGYDAAMSSAKPLSVVAPRSPARTALAAYVGDRLAPAVAATTASPSDAPPSAPRRRRRLGLG
ncbi:MAG: P-loop NTPase [Naasia sp.]